MQRTLKEWRTELTTIKKTRTVEIPRRGPQDCAQELVVRPTHVSRLDDLVKKAKTVTVTHTQRRKYQDKTVAQFGFQIDEGLGFGFGLRLGFVVVCN